MCKKNIWRKNLAAAVTVLFVVASFLSVSGCEKVAWNLWVKKSNMPIFIGSILYVGGSGPDNYSRIQDAIDNASDGDTVFVFDDSSPYHENVVVNKSINLIGENKESTVIDGGGKGDVVAVTADRVSISGFTIQNSGNRWYYDAGIEIISNLDTISGNNILNNGHGIRLEGFSNNTIMGNTISSNRWDGIYLEDSNNNTISDNNISNNCRGIYLDYSTDNVIVNNEINRNREVGFYFLWESLYNLILDNKVNGEIYYHIVNASDLVIENLNLNAPDVSNLGKISLIDCINITLRNLTLSNNYGSGVSLHKSNLITIENSVISNNEDGIFFEDSNDNNIKNNSVSDNKMNGIYLLDFSNSKVSSNTITNNREHGIYLLGCRSNIISGNNISWNAEGMFFQISKENIIAGNTISSNSRYGIDSSSNTIVDNYFFNNGLFVGDSCRNNVSNNVVNGKPLVYLDGESNQIIDYDAGQIILVRCSNIIVRNQKLFNASVGVQLVASYNCFISNNAISNNYYGLTLMSDSNNNTISGNTINSNYKDGIYFRESTYNNVLDNIISKNTNGIYLENLCDMNIISGNEFMLNKGYGIFIKLSYSNAIRCNNFIKNSEHASFEFPYPDISNRWNRNYWDNWPGLIPKPILGRVGVGWFYYYPWVNFDWFPTRRPYEIRLS